MPRRLLAAFCSGALILAVAAPALGKAVDTTVRTIQDTNEDNLLEYAPGEDHIILGADEGFRPPRDGSILNFLQLSDFQIVDEESPARVEFLDWTQRGGDPLNPFKAAYRPQESVTTHVTEAMVRSIQGARSPVTGEPLALTILTGDNADSQQYNETRWFIDILDGGAKVDPDSGIPSDECPATEGSAYDGVRGGGSPYGYYDPDASGAGTDGDGYSPDREQNLSATGKDVTLRDFPGLLEAANRPFRTRGLRMPWYSAFGNHDALVQGNSPEAYFGPYGPSSEVADPAYHDIAIGCTKPRFGYAGDPPSFLGSLQDAANVPPDARRCFLAKDEAPMAAPAPCDGAGWIEQHFATTGTPVGHGFVLSSELSPRSREAAYGRPDVADANNDGYYSFSPRAGIRFVVLDTITDECGVVVCSEGSLDDPQFQWLAGQIAKAAEMGAYVFVFSHHTLKTTRFPSTDPTEQPIHYGQRFDRETPYNPQNPSVKTLEELFCESPNVIAHIAGHEHENYIRHHTCEEDSPATVTGDSDFWHISTAAHIDWPQQARMVELVENRDGTMSLVLTMFDHAGPPRVDPEEANLARANGDQVLELASIGRELAYNDYQYPRSARGDAEERNVIIVLDRAWPYRSSAG